MPGEAKPTSVSENTVSLAFDLSRRDFVATASATAASGFALGSGRAAIVRDTATLPPYAKGTLPPGIRSRTVANVNGLTVHILEAGYENPGRPAVLLLHGFPRTRLQLAQGYAAAHGGWISCDRPGSAATGCSRSSLRK
jgi:hypothetical protein